MEKFVRLFKFVSYVLASLFLCFSMQASFAQAGPEVLDVRPFTPLQGSSMESVSLMNGSLNLDIPVWSVPQRGNLTLDFALHYDSPTFTLDYECDDGLNATPVSGSNSSNPNFRPPNGSCTFPNCDVSAVDEYCMVTWDLDADDAYALYPFAYQSGVRILSSTDVGISVDFKRDPATGATTAMSYSVRTPDGGTHILGQTSAGDYRVLDGTGWEYDPNSCMLRDSKGSRYVFQCNSATFDGAPYRLANYLLYVEDINGNRITLNYNYWTNPSGGLEHTFTSWSDTMGRVVPAFGPPRVGTIPSACPSGSTGVTQWQPPNAAAPIILCGSTVPVQTDLWTGNSYAYERPDEYTEYVGGFGTIGAMILPSGDKWTFSYTPLPGDQYFGTTTNFGELRQIGLPTGGSIQYHWAHATSFCGVNPDNTVARSNVLERDILSAATAIPARWRYNVGAAVVNPDGSSEQIDVFSAVTCSWYPHNERYYDAQNNLIYTETTNYQVLNPTNLVNLPNWPAIQTGVMPTDKIKTWADGMQSKIHISYDQGVAFPTVSGGTESISNGLVTSEDEYDYGANIVGKMLRSKTTAYLAASDSSYFSQNLISLPSVTTVVDDVTGATQSTQWGYDETSLSSGNASGAQPAGWDASPPNGNIRGNLTSIRRFVNTSNSYLTTTMTYNDTGTVASLTLPDNENHPNTTTNYRWSSDFEGGLLTSTINALGQTNVYDYYPTTFLLKSKADPNNVTTTFTYYPDSRLHSITLPPNSQGQQGVTEYRYPSPNEVDSRTKQSASTWITHQDLYDGLGRKIQSILLGGCGANGSISTETTYDLLDRVLTQANPHCSGTSSSTDGITIHGSSPTANNGYDTLGRPLLIASPDGNTQTWSYTDNSTTFTDESGSSWTRTTDGLGRLVGVVEPGGLNTSYGYSAFGDLTSVVQNGVSGETSRSRSFTYDSLSRLITSSNPETGTICYGTGGVAFGATSPNLVIGGGPIFAPWTCKGGYDAHGNLLYKTDANGVTLSYTYDALNRLVGKSASDGSVNDTNTYDQGSYGIGRLSSAANGSVSNSFTYDALGHVVGVGYSLPASGGASLQPGMAVGYDLAGNETSLTYPDGRVVTQSFDVAGRLAKVSSEGTDYISGGAGAGIAYWPSGTEQSFTLGNGVAQTNLLNNRLQPCHTWAVSSVLPVPTPGVGNLFDRQSFFNASLSSPCGNEAGNNGNIFAITDNLNQGWNQGFTYDALNRLTSASRADGGYNHTYNYDSFGNMTVQDNLNANNPTWWIDPATNRLLRNPVFFSSPGGSGGSAPSASDYTYDAAGNLLSNGTGDSCAPGVNGTSGNCGHTFAYNALNQVLSVDSGNAANYVYNGMDERVYKSTPSGWTQYMYFNSQPMAEYDNNGIWTDYVYANGQKIAKVQSAAPVWHLSGVGTGSTDCGAQYWVAGTPAPVAGTQIAAGDQLVVDMKAIGAHMDFLLLIDGSAWTDTVDQDGYSTMDYARTDGAWHHRIIDLAPWVGHTATALNVGIQQYGPAGQDDVWMRNAALVR